MQYLQDSLGGKRRDLMDLLWRYLKEEHFDKKCVTMEETGWTFVDGSQSTVPQQDNNDDCGIFACMFINLLFEFVADERNLAEPITTEIFNSFSAKNIPRIRQQMQLDILRGEIFRLEE
jgi:Ulp1 family protease